LNQTSATTFSSSGLHWITKYHATAPCWLLRFKLGHLIHNTLCTQPYQKVKHSTLFTVCLFFVMISIM